MKNKFNSYTDVRLRVLPSHDREIEKLKDSVKSEYKIRVFKNDIIRIAIAEFLETNQDLDKFKETLEKHNYI